MKQINLEYEFIINPNKNAYTQENRYKTYQNPTPQYKTTKNQEDYDKQAQDIFQALTQLNTVDIDKLISSLLKVNNYNAVSKSFVKQYGKAIEVLVKEKIVRKGDFNVVNKIIIQKQLYQAAEIFFSRFFT